MKQIFFLIIISFFAPALFAQQPSLPDILLRHQWIRVDAPTQFHAAPGGIRIMRRDTAVSKQKYFAKQNQFKSSSSVDLNLDEASLKILDSWCGWLIRNDDFAKSQGWVKIPYFRKIN